MTRPRIRRPRGRATIGLALATAALAAIPLVARGADQLGGDNHLAAVGPVDQSALSSASASGSGYPTWYRDGDGTTLELCLDAPGAAGVADDPCALAGTFPDARAGVTFPDNFPNEAFYWSANAGMDVGSPGAPGRASLVLAIEAAFANEEVVDGDQMVFARSRFRIDTPRAGDYTVTWPYGRHTFTSAGGKRGINVTQDIGITPGQFADALEGGIGPFLRWAPNPLDATDVPPAGYVGDGATEHLVTGSPMVDGAGEPQNYFRIEGPEIRQPGDAAHACPGRPNDLNCIQVDTFVVLGKLATRGGVEATRASYSIAPGGRFLDVFGVARPGDRVIVQGSGIRSTELTADANGRYFGRAPLGGGAPPAEVVLRNTTDRPNARWYARVTDTVEIRSAVYDAGSQTLEVRAASSDGETQQTLTATGLGDLVAGADPADEQVLSVTTPAPPASVTVTSSAGGSASAPVAVGGAAMAPVAARAVILAPTDVEQLATVELSGIDSEGDIASWSWSQDGGDRYQVLSGPRDQSTIAFDVPALTSGGDVPSAASADLHFTLSVTDVGGATDEEQVVVHVVPAAAPEPAIAAPARAPQRALVQLDAAASLHVGRFSWQQIDVNTDAPISGGSPVRVAVAGATTARPSFTMPDVTDFDAAGVDALRFRLTAESATTETAVADVDVQLWRDDIGITRAEYRIRTNTLRIVGTTDVFGGGGNIIRAYRGDEAVPAAFLGEVQVVPGVPDPPDPQTGDFDLILEPDGGFPGAPVTVTLVTDAGATRTIQVPVIGVFAPPAAVNLVARVAAVTPLAANRVQARIVFRARGAKGDQCTLRVSGKVRGKKRCKAGTTTFVVRAKRGATGVIQVSGARQRAVRTAPFRIG